MKVVIFVHIKLLSGLHLWYSGWLIRLLFQEAKYTLIWRLLTFNLQKHSRKFHRLVSVSPQQLHSRSVFEDHQEAHTAQCQGRVSMALVQQRQCRPEGTCINYNAVGPMLWLSEWKAYGWIFLPLYTSYPNYQWPKGLYRVWHFGKHNYSLLILHSINQCHLDTKYKLQFNYVRNLLRSYISKSSLVFIPGNEST